MSPATARLHLAKSPLTTAAGLLAAAALFAAAPHSRANSTSWAGSQYTPGPGYPAAWPTEGSWFDSNHWLNGLVPTYATTAYFQAQTLMPNANTTHYPHIIHLGNFGYCGSTVIPGGGGTVGSAFFMDYDWTLDLASGQNPDFTGTLTPSVGMLGAGTIWVGPTSTSKSSLTIRNGTITTGTLSIGIGNEGLVTLTPGARINAGTAVVGASATGSGGRFDHSGGTHVISTKLSVGKGTYTLSAGVLTTPLSLVGDFNAGTFAQTAGTHTVSGTLAVGNADAGVGHYLLGDGLLAVSVGQEYAGYSGRGTFTQSGGTHTIANNFYAGYNSEATGTYTLSGGLLTAANAYLGYSGKGYFNQAGGTHTVGGLYLGYTGYSNLGVYTLSAGQLNASNVYVAYDGSYPGTFTQTGGTHTVGNNLAIGVKKSTHGTYTLSGSGALSVANVYLGGSDTLAGGIGSLIISGGTATVSNTLKIWNKPPYFSHLLALSGGTLSVGTLDMSLYPAAVSWTAGTLILTNLANAPLTVPSAGTLKGSATIAGNLTNHGTLAPGNSAGLLAIQGDFTQSGTATLQLEIAGPAASEFDRLVLTGTGNVSLAGTLAVDFLPTYTPALGDTFDFFDFTGAFTDNGYTFDFTHAPLPEGLVWNTSAFPATGQLSIAAVPEPATLALLALAAPCLLACRRRSSGPRPR